MALYLCLKYAKSQNGPNFVPKTDKYEGRVQRGGTDPVDKVLVAGVVQARLDHVFVIVVTEIKVVVWGCGSTW